MHFIRIRAFQRRAPPVAAEVMKPLATPVIGGMISGLLHILIVAPGIFLSAQLNLAASPGRSSAEI